MEEKNTDTSDSSISRGFSFCFQAYLELGLLAMSSLHLNILRQYLKQIISLVTCWAVYSLW